MAASRSARIARVARIREQRERIAKLRLARADRERAEARGRLETVQRYAIEAAIGTGSREIPDGYLRMLLPHVTAAEARVHDALQEVARHREAMRQAYRKAEGARRALQRAVEFERIDEERSERTTMSEIALRRWEGPSHAMEGCAGPGRSPIVGPMTPASSDGRKFVEQGTPSGDGTSWHN